MSENEFDLVVIGAGPGGYVAAIRSAQLGMKTAVIEREHLGGICLNWGCIPTKALLRSSEIYTLLHHLDDFGLSAKDISFDISKIVKRSRTVSGQLAGGVGYLLKKNKVTVIDGEARLKGGGAIAVAKDGKALSDVKAKHIILATGARARSLPGLEPDGKQVWTYKEAMVPEALPKSLLVVGSGAIGIEFASFYNSLGVKTTVVEVMDRVLPVEDEEISALAAKAFGKQGMVLKTSTTVEKLDKSAGHVTATLKSKDGKTESLRSTGSFWRLALPAMWKISVSRKLASKSTGAMWKSTSGVKPAWPGFTPSAISPGRPGLLTGQSRRGLMRRTHCRRRRRPSAKHSEHSRMYLLQSAGRQHWHDGSRGKGSRSRDQCWAVSVHGQRQGHSPW